jgi:peptide/nickel transport system substrate-binding protein
VTTQRPDEYTLIYKLKDAYSPFLVTVTRPVFDYGYVGSGDYRVEKVERNGSFVQSLTISSVKNRQNTITYEFYPTESALKLAYLLGEISEAQGVTDISYNKASLDKYSNTKVTQHVDYSRLVTLFFNTTDPDLSDKKLRLGLSYGIPDTFKEGLREYLPYSPKSIYYNNDVEIRKLDYAHAKLLMLSSDGASQSAQKSLPSVLTIKTLQKYASVAQGIADSWKNLGIKTTVDVVDSVPNQYQIFLGEFNVPKDPDQYTLWHSNSKNNITHYKNLRIDKLLEDGRKTVDINERKKFYNDFQKYLTDDAPAAFLYFPSDYMVMRK